MDNEKQIDEPSKTIGKVKLTPVFDMLEDACNVYFKNIKKFIGIYLQGLIGFIPLFAILVVFVILLQFKTTILAMVFFKIFIVVALFLACLWAVYYSVRMRAAMMLIIRNNYDSATKSFADSKKYFWAYIWVSLLSSVVIGLWSLLFIIPGVIFMVYYLMVNYTFFFEDFKGRMALRRSRELVKGYWWPVFGRLAFIGLAAFIINFVMAIPITYLTKGSAGYDAYNLFINIVWALLAPIIIIYSYYIFRDLLKIKGESKLEKKPTKKQNILDAILVAVVISLFILFMVIAAAASSSRLKADDEQTLANVKQLQLGLVLYKMNNGAWPENLEPFASSFPVDYLKPFTYTISGDSYKLCYTLEQTHSNTFGNLSVANEQCTTDADFKLPSSEIQGSLPPQSASTTELIDYNR
jgi:hypothetical protein